MSGSEKDVFNALKRHMGHVTQLFEIFGDDIEHTSKNEDILSIMESFLKFSHAFSRLIEPPASKLAADFQTFDEEFAEATKHSKKIWEASKEEWISEAENKEKLQGIVSSTLKELKNNEETLEGLLLRIKEVETQEKKAADILTLNDEQSIIDEFRLYLD